MQKRPTHTAVNQFISTILPSKTNDVQFLYHIPRNPKYSPDTARVDQIVLSVTPTPGVYDYIGYDPTSAGASLAPRPPRTVCFLHRPFTLERRSVRRGTLVLASHTSFDEILTVGWNTALAARLEVNVGDSICVQGYKGDPERKIGIIGRLQMPKGLLLRRIEEEFGSTEIVHEGLSENIHVVAIMNAFHADEVDRVLDTAQQREWTQQGEHRGSHVFYLTGQPRESGLAAAKDCGMSVVCVGHRMAEEWGIRYLATRLRASFPGLRVNEVYEEEAPRKQEN